MEFYTYIWRDAAGVPFYVGKGKGKRAYNTRQRSSEFKDIFEQGGCLVEIVDWFIHESQAHAHEVELIELYGRRELGGTLVNKTDGGEGLSGASAEVRNKISMAAKATWSDPDFRSKIAIRRSGLKRSSAARLNMTAAQSSRFEKAEERLRISATLRKHYESAEAREKISVATTGVKRSDGARASLSASQRTRPPRIGYKGVSFHKASGKWCAQLTLGEKRKYLGLFGDPETAAQSYNAAAIDAFGPGNCYLNDIGSGTKNVAI